MINNVNMQCDNVINRCVVQAMLYRCSRMVPCGTAGALVDVLGIFWLSASVEMVRAVLPRGSCLLGREC